MDPETPAARFERRLRFVLLKEGGFVDHRADPGGATNHGISLRYAVSKGRVLDLDHDGDVDAADIRLITPAVAADLYRKDFWRPVRGDELPAPLDLVLFDAAVNCGVGRAVGWLQTHLGVRSDGDFGPRTLDALRQHLAQPGALPPLVREMLARRISHHAALDDLPEFRLGWSRRLAALCTLAGQELLR